MLDLDEVRSVLLPLDLEPLFLVVGGEHLFGFPGPAPRVRVRGVLVICISMAGFSA